MLAPLRILLSISAAFAAVVVRGAVGGEAPNIVVILADDLGWADLGHDGSQIDTPNLDRLAKQGIKLTRFYASAPMCSPTRAALLTGRYPHGVGMPELASPAKRGNVPPLALANEAITIPEALQPAGYRSIAVGKWHLGFTEAARPRQHGFHEFWGSLLGTPGFWQPKETYHNETPITVQGHYTDALTSRAVQYVRDHDRSRGPLFLYLAYNAPHYPLEAPAELISKYRRRFADRGFFAVYAAMVEQLDTGIGRVLTALEERGLTENTLIVFTSDNGPSAEPPGPGVEAAEASNGPLREYKFSTHEGGLRVPFLAKWPGRIPAGAVRHEVGVTMDLLPTFLAVAGVTPAAGHEIHGTSLLPLLRGEPFSRAGAIHWETSLNAAVLRGDWKLVHQYWQPPRLYRVAEDIGEERDLAAQHPETVAELLALHDAWRMRHYPNPIPRELKRSNYAFPAPPARKSNQ
jgi:arylsulfatase A-like enzyme